MFKEEIKIEKENDVRYGTTEVPAHKTLNELMELLKKYDCDRIVTDYQGDNMRLCFIYRGDPYVIPIPKVYVRGEYNEKIGVRVVYHYLRILLSWTEAGIMSLDKALMSYRTVMLDGRTVSMSEIMNKMDNGSLLPEDTDRYALDEGAVDAEYEEVE